MNEYQNRRHILAWHAAWGRVNLALEPPAGRSPPTPLEIMEALRMAREALRALETDYGPQALR